MVAPASNVNQRHKQPNPPWFLLHATAIFGIIMALTWREVVRRKEDGKYTLKEERIRETLRELERTEKCEVYYLIARVDGWYMCHLCDQGVYYLHAGEIWKIGMSCNPIWRYKSEWLQQMNLQYKTVFEGDLKQCRQEEIKLIARFPLSLQNFIRPEAQRLVVPPGHKTIKLK